MDSTPILKRPKPTDSEDELFRMQEEFLRNKQQPSAKVINLRDVKGPQSNSLPTETSKDQSKTGRVKSRFSELKKLKLQDRLSTSRRTGDIINPTVKEEAEKALDTRPHDAVHNLPVAPSNIILGNIFEKKYNSSNYEFESNDASGRKSDKGFPEVFVSAQMKSDGNQSLFWKEVSQKGHIANKIETPQTSILSCSDENSVIVEGPWAKEIHTENLERLNQMSHEDILKERSKLEMTLKPDLIEFLKNRKHKKQKLKDDHEKTIKCEASTEKEMVVDTKESMSLEITGNEPLGQDTGAKSMEVDEVEVGIPKPPMELMEQAKEKGWVHMDSIEPEKLKWMEDLPIKKKNEPSPGEPYNARFDFNGLLLPYKDEDIPVEKGLYHHGEEPERPGYSLQELLQLSRSSTQQQRCTALTTLANIIEKSRRGWYDKVLQPAPLTALSQRNLLLLLRFSLDDTSVSIVTATLQALRAFLYSEADEICLDRLYGFNTYKEPILAPSKSDVNETSNLKDHELAQLDAVAALLRTDIVLRIRYILSKLQPPPIAVTCALEILIRLTRRSKETALNIASTPHLVETVVENFMPLSTHLLAAEDNIKNVYGVPLASAIKFCRVLLSYGGTPVAHRLNRLKVVQSIITYVSCDAGKRSINLSIESLRLWKTMLIHEVAADSLEGTQLILLSQLQLLLSNHDLQNASELSSEYAASLIAVASCLTPLRSNISVLLRKWSTQMLSLSTPTWTSTKLIVEALLAVGDNSELQKLVISKSQVFARLSSTSNLLSNCTLATDREPSSLPNLGVLTQDGRLQPIVSQDSCIPFLATALTVFVRHSCIVEIQAVLDTPEMYRYLKNLEVVDWSLERSWYTRSELFFLTAVVQAAFMVKDKINNKLAHVIWKIAIKLISSLPADLSSNVKDMLRIVLSVEKLNLEILMNELVRLNLNSNINDIKMYLNSNVALLYERYVTSSDEWEQAAMPKDWLYLPLVHIYTKCKNNDTCSDEDKSNILTLLSLELILPDLVENLSQSLRFSRLVLVYLCDTLYLHKDVSILLTKVISTLLKDHYKKLNFTLHLPGLNSFTDLFTAMCEHFCSTSYGDYGFSMTLLVPIAQKHDVHYRKLLWSEHAGLLRYLRLPLEELIVPLKEYFYPVEEDTSLIESYLTALVRGIVNQNWCPIPYAIAVHHSALYLRQNSKLALRMRTQIEKLPDKRLATILLCYEPPVL